MPLPKDIVFIRHGESEANVVGTNAMYATQESRPAGFQTRHDSYMRLSPLGVEQAKIAGEWLRENNLAHPDSQYSSPHIRTRETAAHLSLGNEWIVDDLWRERDWGEYGAKYSKSDQEKNFPFSAAMKKQSSWYWKPVGGESLATGVRFRFDSVINSLGRMVNIESVIGVTHGEFINVARFVLERMTPEQWIEMDNDPKNKIQNAMIVHYSRVNPDTGVVSKHFKFKRMVCPWDTSLSIDNGDWVYIKTRKFSDDDLLKSVEIYPNLL